VVTRAFWLALVLIVVLLAGLVVVARIFARRQKNE